MTQEEKAKRYDETIKKLRSLHDNYDTVSTLIDVKEELENIFPELAESEDERIRKALIEFIKSRGGFKGEWITWLEKKCEQKPVISDDALREGIIHFGITQYQIDNWLKKYVYIEKQGKQKPVDVRTTGYWHVEDVEQNTTWSEEDREMRMKVLKYLSTRCNVFEYEEVETWLKSLKDRVQLQNIAYYNPYKEVVESIAEMCQHYDNMDVGSLQDFYDNVKVKCKDAKEYDSLFPQNAWKPSGEQIKLLEDICGYNTIVTKEEMGVLESLLEELKKLTE